jgi:hypothetical protein
LKPQLLKVAFCLGPVFLTLLFRILDVGLLVGLFVGLAAFFGRQV